MRAVGQSKARQGAAVVPGPDVLERVFPGDSEMARRMRAFDWERAPIGPPEEWPGSLRNAVRIILTSRQPMFVWWGERLINLYNDRYGRFLCGKHPGALGQPASRVWPEIWDQVGPRMERAMRRFEGTYDEALPFVMLRKGYPEATWVTFSYCPIPDDHGGVGGILCPVTEETKRIIGERQLALLVELAARTADARTWPRACALAAGALATDPEDFPFALLYLVDAERRSATLAGSAGVEPGSAAAPRILSLEEAARWPVGEVCRARRACELEDVSAVAPALPLLRGRWPVTRAVALPVAASGGAPTAGVLVAGVSPLRALDGEYRAFLDLVAGQVSNALANAGEYEAERRRAEALAELDRAKTLFFNDVSHELRTPLTLILGPVEDALARLSATPGAEGARADLETVHRNAVRLLKLVNDLLDLSRIEAGRMQASLQPTDLAAFTRELASVFAPAVERAGLRLVTRCDPLPRPVQVDRRMWERIVLNLLSNALKFTMQGEIALELRPATEGVELTVRDTGAGIPADELPRVFDRFYRVQGATARTGDGSGIGLALVQELVKQHGGRVSVGSALGEGTVFSVTIPLGAPASAASAPDAAGPTPGSAAYVEEALGWHLPSTFQPVAAAASLTVPERFRSARVLFADDNPEVRDYVSGLLAPWFQVEAAANGLEALEACRTRRPDLLLCDVMMPGLDGFAVLRALRADPALRTIPVILLSARAGEDSRVEGLQGGADDYLVKPFSARELVARVRSNLELAELRLEVARERGAREEAQRVLIEELQHRARNLLAVVRSIAAQVLRSGRSPEEIEAQLGDRLDALGRLQTLLTRGGPAVTVRDLLALELGALGPAEGAADGRVSLEGPEVSLPRRTLQTVALAVHELAANALRHGALRARRGRVAVRWEIPSDERARLLVLEWVETGGPRRRAGPARRGFGRELIERALPYELEARTSLVIGAGGVRCRIELPLEPAGQEGRS
jgi:signal transduction histidine kinase